MDLLYLGTMKETNMPQLGCCSDLSKVTPGQRQGHGTEQGL